MAHRNHTGVRARVASPSLQLGPSSAAGAAGTGVATDVLDGQQVGDFVSPWFADPSPIVAAPMPGVPSPAGAAAVVAADAAAGAFAADEVAVDVDVAVEREMMGTGPNEGHARLVPPVSVWPTFVDVVVVAAAVALVVAAVAASFLDDDPPLAAG